MVIGAAPSLPRIHNSHNNSAQNSSCSDDENQIDESHKSPYKFRYQRLYSDYEDFLVPPEFDVTKSTCENYTMKSRKTFGCYADIRESLDHDYHGNYNRERQKFQDILIRNVVGAAVEKEWPWIVFSAGAMGAGKSHVIHWMSQRGYFPLPDVVHIDPDLFRMGLPEWEDYLKYDPLQAGSKTRMESGYMVEIAQEAAMRLKKNIWVDGSLRDAEWYNHVFAAIRSNHPHYSIAILYVYAKTETVFARARKRGDETGRYVPEEEIKDSLERVPRSVVRLQDHADFVAFIRNEGEEPEMTDFIDGDGHHVNDGGFTQMSARFATLHQLQDPSHHKEHVEEILAQPGVTLFSKSYCSYCDKMKAILQGAGVSFNLIELDRGAYGVALQHELSKLSGTHTTPQLFIDGQYIGGYDQVVRLYRTGQLSTIFRKYSLTTDEASRKEEQEERNMRWESVIRCLASSPSSSSSCLKI